jgi:O-antigen/teichoic acid export membrane protein
VNKAFLALTRLFNRSLLATLGVRICILVFGFATSIITARFLGPTGRGDYFYIITLASMIAQFGNLGMQTSNTYWAAKDKTLIGKLLINSTWAALLVGSIVALSVGSYLNLTSNHLTWTAVLQMAALAPAMIFFLLAPSILIGAGKIREYNLFQMFAYMLVSSLLIATGFISPTAGHFVWAAIIGWWIVNIALFLFIKGRKRASLSWLFDRSLVQSSLRYNVKIFIGSLLGFFVLKSSVLIIQALLPAQELGYFSIASQLNDTMVILPTTIGLLLFPKIVKAQEQAWQCLQQNLLATSLIMLIVCTLAYFLVAPFIQIAFGHDFLPACQILRWMLPATFFYALTSIVSQFLTAAGFPRSQVVTWALGLLLVIALNYLFIPHIGITGAALALSITFAFIFIVLYTIAIKLAQKTASTGSSNV